MTVIIHFNQLAQLAIRSTSTGLQLGSKFMALVALAQRTAVQRFARPDVQVAAAAYAGHGVLTRFFPLQSATFDAVMRGYTAGLTAAQRATVAARAANIAQRIVAQRWGCRGWLGLRHPSTQGQRCGKRGAATVCGRRCAGHGPAARAGLPSSAALLCAPSVPPAA